MLKNYIKIKVKKCIVIKIKINIVIIYMPHFYKLTDGKNILRNFKKEWLDIVTYTIRDLI